MLTYLIPQITWTLHLRYLAYARNCKWVQKYNGTGTQVFRETWWEELLELQQHFVSCDYHPSFWLCWTMSLIPVNTTVSIHLTVINRKKMYFICPLNMHLGLCNTLCCFICLSTVKHWSYVLFWILLWLCAWMIISETESWVMMTQTFSRKVYGNQSWEKKPPEESIDVSCNN